MFVNPHICELIFQNQYENKIMWKMNLFTILIFFLMIILKTMFCQEKSCDKKVNDHGRIFIFLQSYWF